MRPFHKYVGLLCGLMLGSGLVAQQVTLKYASAFAASTRTNAVTIPRFISELEKRSEGTVKVEFYPGGTLGAGAKTQIRLVQKGNADMAEVSLPYTPGRIKGLDVFELPGFAQDNLDASRMALELIDQGWITGLDQFVVIGSLQTGPYLIHTRDPIAKLDDLKGLKLRVSGAIQSTMAKRLGAVPVANIPATQLAENLNRRLLDGALMDMGNIYNFKMDEDTKYHVTNLYLGNFAVLFLMNKDSYNKLPPKAKKAMDQLKGDWLTEQLGTEMNIQAEDVQKKLMADPGQHLVQFPPEEIAKAHKLFADLQQTWLKRNKKYQQVLDYVVSHRGR